MEAKLTEEKVLKKLDIKDFKHMTKAKIISLVPASDKVAPDTAKKIVEEYPNFSKIMKEIIDEYKKLIEKGIKSNDESTKKYYETLDDIASECKKELQKDNLTFEERQKVLNTMIQIANMKDAKDNANKKFIVTMCVMSGAAVGITATAILAAINKGGKINIFKKIK